MGPMGGQASIVYARDKWLDRPVVMKASLPGANYEAAMEVRSLAAINSKHVIAVYDAIRDHDGKIAAIVMEEVDGETLDAIFSQKLSHVQKLTLLYQLACGVADMHRGGRIHRDLKPNNMKVRADGLLKIFDFGIATILVDGDATQIGRGTRGYKAPELHGKPPMAVSTKCDSYSIGVMAHQLLSNGGFAPAFLVRPPNPQAAGVGFGALAGTGRLTQLLDASLAVDPNSRPEAVDLRDALAVEIVRDLHRAILVSGGTHLLDASQRAVVVRDAGNEITVEYTGTTFVIRALAGDVFVNNRPAQVGEELTGAMIFTLGGPERRWSRTFVPFDISHPETLV